MRMNRLSGLAGAVALTAILAAAGPAWAQQQAPMLDALVESGDIKTPLETGVLVESDIRATLKDLCEGDLSPRQSPEEITLFKGVGTAIEDLSAAILAYRSTS